MKIEQKEHDVKPTEIGFEVFVVNRFRTGIVETGNIVNVEKTARERYVEFPDFDFERGIIVFVQLSAFRLFDQFLVFGGDGSVDVLMEDRLRGLDVDGRHHGGTFDRAGREGFEKQGIEDGRFAGRNTAHYTEVDVDVHSVKKLSFAITLKIQRIYLI